MKHKRKKYLDMLKSTLSNEQLAALKMVILTAEKEFCYNQELRGHEVSVEDTLSSLANEFSKE